MTTEEKARAYDEALERARIWQNHLYDTNDRDYADELNYIFPDLKEPEDERIRKELIGFLRNIPNSNYTCEEMALWLEKQGEQKHTDMVEALRTEYEKGRADTISEMKSSWSEEDVKKPNGGIVLEDFNDGNGFYKVNLAYLNEEQVKEIEELVKRWDCQPKENEDESIISDLLDYFDEDKCLKHEVNDVVKWLKTIKPQPKHKWSIDDERVIAIINNALTESNTPPDDYDKVYDWLESLRQRIGG